VLKAIVQDLVDQNATVATDLPGRTKPTRWYYAVADLDGVGL
jgi:hypothetical protein